MSKSTSIATLLAQANHYIDPDTGAVTPPISSSTTFARDSNYAIRQPNISYARDGNPAYITPEKLLAKLEDGNEALLFGSGLAAATTLVQGLKPGDHIVIPEIVYHGFRDWLISFCRRWNVHMSTYDGARLKTLERALKPKNTRLLWIETPANPTWTITDIAAASELAHRAGAYVAVDSTVSTPMLTQPLKLGADFVFHSATKYLNGHSDVVAGVLVCKEKNELWEAVCFLRKHGGAILGAFEAWLLLRGMRTLHIRMHRACDNAVRIAQHLVHHKKVDRVLYPGLPTHQGHDIARRQMRGGFGAMLSILVKGGAQPARALAGSTRLFVPATSLGGVESLIEHRASVEGPNSPVAENLVRLSVGIEDADDLIADLDQALDTVDCSG